MKRDRSKDTFKQWYKNSKNKFTTVRIPNDEIEKVRQLAVRDNMSVGAKIREFVTWGLEAENDPIAIS